MPDYRLYMLNAAGRIESVPVEFQCASDEEAIEQSHQYRDGKEMELWQQARRVKWFPKRD